MEQLHQLADEIRETFDERGWKIEQAVDLDPAFGRSRRSQSSLGRDLAVDAIETASKRLGLECRSVSGGACDVLVVAGDVVRHHRVRKATKDVETGEYEVVCHSDSILAVEDSSETLLREERWILGYTVTDEGMVAAVFAARVLGLTNDSVPRLVLGQAIELGSNGTDLPPGGFRPADEFDLDLGDEDEDPQSDAL